MLILSKYILNFKACEVSHSVFYLWSQSLIICSDPFYYKAQNSKETPVVQSNSKSGRLTTQKLVFTQEVDDALIVGCKQSDRIFEQKHKGRIDHTICQFIGIDLEEKWRCYEQSISSSCETAQNI